MAFMGAPLRENWIATARSPGRARSAAAQAPGLVTSRPSMDVMMSPRRMPAASDLALDADHGHELAGDGRAHLAPQRRPERDRVGVEEAARRGQGEGKGFDRAGETRPCASVATHLDRVLAGQQLVPRAVGGLHADVGAPGGPIGRVRGGLDHLAGRRADLDGQLRRGRQLDAHQEARVPLLRRDRVGEPQRRERRGRGHGRRGRRGGGGGRRRGRCRGGGRGRRERRTPGRRTRWPVRPPVSQSETRRHPSSGLQGVRGSVVRRHGRPRA